MYRLILYNTDTYIYRHRDLHSDSALPPVSINPIAGYLQLQLQTVIGNSTGTKTIHRQHFVRLWAVWSLSALLVPYTVVARPCTNTRPLPAPPCPPTPLPISYKPKLPNYRA